MEEYSNHNRPKKKNQQHNDCKRPTQPLPHQQQIYYFHKTKKEEDKVKTIKFAQYGLIVFAVVITFAFGIYLATYISHFYQKTINNDVEQNVGEYSSSFIVRENEQSSAQYYNQLRSLENVEEQSNKLENKEINEFLESSEIIEKTLKLRSVTSDYSEKEIKNNKLFKNQEKFQSVSDERTSSSELIDINIKPDGSMVANDQSRLINNFSINNNKKIENYHKEEVLNSNLQQKQHMNEKTKYKIPKIKNQQQIDEEKINDHVEKEATILRLKRGSNFRRNHREEDTPLYFPSSSLSSVPVKSRIEYTKEEFKSKKKCPPYKSSNDRYINGDDGNGQSWDDDHSRNSVYDSNGVRFRGNAGRGHGRGRGGNRGRSSAKQIVRPPSDDSVGRKRLESATGAAGNKPKISDSNYKNSSINEVSDMVDGGLNLRKRPPHNNELIIIQEGSVKYIKHRGKNDGMFIN